ncbi:MAG: hypothetical protein ABI632_07450 [Pseudolysinimonas sp.]
MFTARRAAVVALPALLVFGLTGCSLLQAQDANDAPTGVAACALGHTWKLDTKDIATQVSDLLKKGNVAVTSVTADGSQTLDWGIKGDVTMDTNYTLTVTVTPAADQSTVATQIHKGKVTGKAYINSEVAIPRDWADKDFSVKTTYVVNGKELGAKDPIPFTVATTDFDDTVGLELTCDGTTMTTHPRGSKITQSWTRGD